MQYYSDEKETKGKASSGGKAGQLEVVEGGEVRIPCSITPPPTSPSSAHRSSRIGTVNLVLWYKGDDKTSIYSQLQTDTSFFITTIITIITTVTVFTSHDHHHHNYHHSLLTSPPHSPA
ncbi:hypothetical protein E2C01_030105 [Portunus trituberculatus]|uniref:Uncharacterized protein n=1 Tax=Portunus trituberculatus TaxID=210409 RepID=A0A5B7ETS8_PORTR|nr:hypothetical protein [Portunus trituberculatus]